MLTFVWVIDWRSTIKTEHQIFHGDFHCQKDICRRTLVRSTVGTAVVWPNQLCAICWWVFHPGQWAIVESSLGHQPATLCKCVRRVHPPPSSERHTSGVAILPICPKPPPTANIQLNMMRKYVQKMWTFFWSLGCHHWSSVTQAVQVFYPPPLSFV